MPLLTGPVAAGTYARYRSGLRRHMQAYASQRTVPLGPHLQLLFEDRLTVSYQTLEAMFDRRLDPDFDAEENLTRYAHLLPSGHRLCATLRTSLPDAQRSPWLPLANQAVHQVCLEVQGQAPVCGSIHMGLPEAQGARTDAVHGLRFDLPCQVRAALLDGAPACLSCRHAACEWRQALASTLVQRLRAELDPGAWAAGLAAAVGAASEGVH